MRDYWVFIKGMYNVLKRSLVALFFEQLLWTEEIHANWSRKKHSCLVSKSRFIFVFEYKRTNLEWYFEIFTFTSQRRLLELPNYDEYNHLFTSVVCFLKTTHLSVHRFYSFNFFSWRIMFPQPTFLPLKNIDHSIRILKTINNIYLDQF